MFPSPEAQLGQPPAKRDETRRRAVSQERLNEMREREKLALPEAPGTTASRNVLAPLGCVR
jgi:hypothetical protein